MLPQTNATLTRVRGSGSGESYDDSDSAPGAEKWAGQAEAYFRERRDRLFTGGGAEDRVLLAELIVATDDPAVDWRSGDYVDVDVAGTRRVKLVERRQLDGIPPDVQTTRLTLEPA